MNISKYSIVLPVRGESINDFISVQFKLYEQYINLSQIEEFIIVTPESYLDRVTSFFKDSLLPVTFYSDESILKTYSEGMPGWYKQQIIKLLIASLIKTKHYLIIDDDLFLKQNLSINNFFLDQRIIYSNEQWPINGPSFATNTSWWEGSSRLINFDVYKLMYSIHNMGVTPQLMITEQVNNLLQYLLSLHGSQWIDLFIKLKATEFSLYWIYLVKMDLLQFYTPYGKKLFSMNKKCNVLEKNLDKQTVREIVRRGITQNDDYFFVVQSWLDYDKKWYIDLLTKLILN